MRFDRIAAGAASGTAATVAMTGSMALGQLTGRHGEQAPKRVVRIASERLGVPARRAGAGTRFVSGAAHLGFGAACGAVYGAVVRRPSTARGVAFALGVWAGSYAGWIPALWLLPPPQRDNPVRAATVLVAHITYGAVLGHLLARFNGRSTSRATPPRRPRSATAEKG